MIDQDATNSNNLTFINMKKVIVIVSAVVFFAVLALNISINKDGRTGSVTLLNISATPEANAECYPNNGAPGRCHSDGYQEPYCFYDFAYECAGNLH